jgi:inosine/xanthosine triphosphatase
VKINVGSKNPVKINSVINAASETWPDVVVKGSEVPSGIADQPMSDEETYQGALNRAKAVLEDADLGVGLEGGVFVKDNGEVWSTVWAVVIDQKGNTFSSNGARFKVPKVIGEAIVGGGEMGPVMDKLMGGKDIKHKSGAIGVITKNFIDRTEEYTYIVKLALGLWYGRDWDVGFRM